MDPFLKDYVISIVVGLIIIFVVSTILYGPFVWKRNTEADWIPTPSVEWRNMDRWDGFIRQQYYRKYINFRTKQSVWRAELLRDRLIERVIPIGDSKSAV